MSVKSVFLDNKVNCCVFLWMWLASYQLFTCKRVRLVCAAICRFSSSVGYGCWNHKQFIHELCSVILNDTCDILMVCCSPWDAERARSAWCWWHVWARPPSYSLTSCLHCLTGMPGPRWPCQKRKQARKKMTKGWYSLVATETKGVYWLPMFFSVARAEEPPQLSPWLPNLSNDT